VGDVVNDGTCELTCLKKKLSCRRDAARQVVQGRTLRERDRQTHGRTPHDGLGRAICSVARQKLILLQ